MPHVWFVPALIDLNAIDPETADTPAGPPLVPFPICPDSFLPQHDTVPADVIAQL